MADRVASLLRPLCPVFAVPAHNIHFLREPGAYLATLERLIGGAKRRVALSGLYLGSDALSHRLVSAARARLDAPAPPAMSLLLDHGRGLRRDGIATSVDTAAPLLARGASVALWQTPHMRGWKGALPVRLRELGGVQHMKVHVVDDAVVISGANMAASYFSTRQDRYVVIDDAAVSAFFLSLLDAVGRHSWHIAPDKGLTAPSPHAHRELAREIEALFSASLGRPLASGAIDDADTVFVAPTVQAGPLGIRVDEHATRALLHELRDWSHVSMASGYFNLTRQYARLLARLPHARIIVAGPTANPWHGASGASRHVPNGYAQLQAHFLRQCSTAGPRMLEWARDTWSFHCKGLWGFRTHGSRTSALTVLGSANFGHRSVELDLEAQVVMWSHADLFCQRAREELAHLEAHCQPVTVEQLLHSSRTPPWVWRALLPLIKRWM